jgi:hypothetical protein
MVAALLLVLLGTTAAQHKWNWSSFTQKVFRPPVERGPDDAVYKMLDAARDADVDGYLNCFTGGMRTRIEQVIKETSRSNFAKYLRNQNRRFTSVAVAVKDNADEQTARVRVEYVSASVMRCRTFICVVMARLGKSSRWLGRNRLRH